MVETAVEILDEGNVRESILLLSFLRRQESISKPTLHIARSIQDLHFESA